jgi:hypothetical protein
MAFDFELVRKLLDADRRALSPWGAEAELLPRITRVQGTFSNWHNIPFSALSVENAEGAISEQVAHYRQLNRSLEWTVYAHDAPADLRHRLARSGFEIGEREAILVLDTEQQPSWLQGISEHRVEPVKTGEQLSRFQAVAEAVFGVSHSAIVQELAAALAHGSAELMGYLGFDRGVGACVGRLYVNPRSCFAGLYGGGTLATHRGRGLYRAVVTERVRAALHFGARYIRVDALPTSQPILERLGFRELTHAWPCRLRRLR